MMKQEFEKLLGCEVSPKEYEKIEVVYMWLDGVTKDDMAKLFRFNEQFVLKTLYSMSCFDERLRQRNLFLKNADSTLKYVRDKNSVLNTDNDRLREENYNLRKENYNLQFENDIYKNKLVSKENYTDELETELQQYKVVASELHKEIDTLNNLIEMITN